MTYKHTKLACYIGFTVQAIINNFLPILFIIFQTDYALSYEKLGRIIFINFFVQIISDISTPYIARALGYRKMILLCHILAMSGLCLMSILPTIMRDVYTAIILPVIIYAFGSGIIEVILSPLVESLPSKNHATAMAFTHSFYCWGQVLTVAVTSSLVLLFGFSNWYFIPLIWAIVPFINFMLFLKVPVIEPDRKKEANADNVFFKKREFWCFTVFMICAGVSEIAMSEWTSVFAQNSLGVTKFVGDILGPCAFAVFMGLGRIIFGLLSGRFSVKKVLIFNNILCFACYFIVGISNLAWVSLLCCALCGFSVSLSWPGTYSLAAARFPLGGTIMFSILAFCGDMGCSLGPWILGIVADKINIKAGFSVCSVFPLIMIFAAIFLLKENRCINSKIKV